jgi:hypothetical protein
VPRKPLIVKTHLGQPRYTYTSRPGQPFSYHPKNESPERHSPEGCSPLRGPTRPRRHPDGGLSNAAGPDRAAASSGVGRGGTLSSSAKLIRWAFVRKLAISPQFISQKPALSVAGSRRRIAKEKQEMTTNQEDPYRRDGFIDKAEAFLRPATHEGYSRSPLFRGPGNGIDQQSDKRRLEVPHGKCCRSVMGSRLVPCYTSSEPHYSEHLRWG